MSYTISMASKRSAGAPDGRTLPDRIADHFIARIFTGELAPGSRLPADRELAPQLGVDRTSLRMAMQQLGRMGLIKALRGSGVTVLDYREHAGLDFLAAVFKNRDLSLGGSFLLEALDDWINQIPNVAGHALARATRNDLRTLDAILSQQIALLDANAGLAALVNLEVVLQDTIVRILGNTTLMLMFNSSRPVRAYMARLSLEETNVRQHVKAHQRVLRNATQLQEGGTYDVASDYRAYLKKHTLPLRRRLQALPPNPSLLPSAKSSFRRAPDKPAKKSKAGAATRRASSASA
jgi:DNA-binding FadR family transcriptional regulator